MSSPRSPKPDIAGLDNMLCFHLHAASRAMTAIYRPLLEPLGLTYPQYLVLAALWEYRDQAVGELIQRLQLDYGTMTPLLKRLEKQGLVRRTRNPDDERTVIVTLTPDGQALREHAPGIFQSICTTLDLAPEELAATQHVLQSIVQSAKQSTSTAEPAYQD